MSTVPVDTGKELVSSVSDVIADDCSKEEVWAVFWTVEEIIPELSPTGNEAEAEILGSSDELIEAEI